MSFKETIDFIWTTWESGGVVMFPLILVAFLIYSVAVHLLLSLTRRSFRNLDDETLIKWVEDPKKSEGEVGRIIRFTQDEVFELSDIYSRFSEVSKYTYCDGTIIRIIRYSYGHAHNI